LLPTPAVAQSDGDRAFGGFLAHDVLVQLFDDFTRSHLRHGLQLFDGQIAIGVDADVGGNVQRSLDDVARRQLGRLQEGSGRRLRETPA
jgi:hypothetical protein